MTKKTLPPKPWPRLSDTLTGPKHPNVCQSCGKETDVTDGIGAAPWQEHDENDKPEPIVVMLCRDCSARLIEPHQRLYRRLDVNQPWPGIISFCVDCWWWSGVRCGHPRAKANGGPGVMLTVAAPIHTHLNMGRGKGYWLDVWRQPAETCRQFEPTESKAEVSA